MENETTKVNLAGAGAPVIDDSGVTRVSLGAPLKTEQVEPQQDEQENTTVAGSAEVQEQEGEPAAADGETAEGTIPEEEFQVVEKIDPDAEAAISADEAAQEEAQEEVQEEAQEEFVATVPAGLEKVAEFLNDNPGATLEDYVRLNADYANVDETRLLREYYKSQNPHLDAEEIEFLIEDKFSFDEDIDDEKDIRRKKLNKKQEIAKAQEFLSDLKNKYYTEVKSGANLSPEIREAVKFHTEYQKSQAEQTAQREKQGQVFDQLTESLFSKEFKGFDFQVGDSKYRFNVKNADSVKQAQSDITNVFGKFLKDGVLADAAGYHKALYSAVNADKIAEHFYNQGKADGVKEVMTTSKNISMEARKSDPGYVDAGGYKVRVVEGETSSKLKIKASKF